MFVISLKLFRKTRNKNLRKSRPCRVTRRCSISIDELIVVTYVANQIAAFEIAYDYVLYVN